MADTRTKPTTSSLAIVAKILLHHSKTEVNAEGKMVLTIHATLSREIHEALESIGWIHVGYSVYEFRG